MNTAKIESNKRLRELRKSEFNKTYKAQREVENYLYYHDENRFHNFKELDEQYIESYDDFRMMYKFLKSKTSTLEGSREAFQKQIAYFRPRLNEEYLQELDEGGAKAWTKFFDYVNSEDIADMLDITHDSEYNMDTITSIFNAHPTNGDTLIHEIVTGYKEMTETNFKPYSKKGFAAYLDDYMASIKRRHKK